jgi:beta-glucanase (GH16 family)
VQSIVRLLLVASVLVPSTVAEHAHITSQLPPPPGYTAQNLIFDDRFAGTTLNGNNWNTYITSRAANGWPWSSDGAGGSGISNVPGDDAEYMLPGQVTINNGLALTALNKATPGYYASTPGTFPWRSGVVSTYGKFQFDGGYLQVKARMPSGNGIWPAVWMLPGPGGTNGDDNEIDLFEGGFTGNGVSANQNYSWHLPTPAGTAGGVTNVGVDLTQGYHVYGLHWIPGKSITWYLDGHQVGQVTSVTYPIPNEPMEVLISLSVATSNASGWHTVKDSSSPSPAQMQVAEVQVYQ